MSHWVRHHATYSIKRSGNRLNYYFHYMSIKLGLCKFLGGQTLFAIIHFRSVLPWSAKDATTYATF